MKWTDNVLGLDVSKTATGLVRMSMDGHVMHAETIKPKDLSGPLAWSYTAEHVLTHLAVCGAAMVSAPKLALIEGYGYGNAFSLATLVATGTIVRYFLSQHGVPWTECSPNGVKKFASASGAAPKDKMMMFVLKEWGYESADNNIADAYVCAQIARCVIDPALARQKWQKEVLKAMKQPIVQGLH